MKYILDTIEQVQMDEGHTYLEGNKYSTIKILETIK